MSLRRRVFLSTAAAVVASVGLSLLIGGVLTRRALHQTLVSSLSHQADLLAARAREIGPGFLGRPRFRQLKNARGGPRLALLPLADAESALVGSHASLAAGRPANGTATLAGVRAVYAARPVGANVLVLYRPDRLGAQDWRPFLDSFLIAGLVGAAVAALVSLGLARAIGTPVARVAAASRALAFGHSPGPLPVEGPQEIASLASSFNEMQAELAAAQAGQRSFLLSVSHELKTPLTAIRGYVEAMQDGAIDADEGAPVIEREAARLERLVRDLLDLARLRQRSFEVAREPIDLAYVARDAVARYRPQAEEIGIDLRADAEQPAPATGDGGRALQAVSNLVENALRATPRHGRVTVTAQAGRLTVADTGPGLAAEDLPRAFERFYLHRRAGGDEMLGSGLGLAIVKELTEAMGGSVAVTSEAGSGTQFVLRLPQAAAAAPAPGEQSPA